MANSPLLQRMTLMDQIPLDTLTPAGGEKWPTPVVQVLNCPPFFSATSLSQDCPLFYTTASREPFGNQLLQRLFRRDRGYTSPILELTSLRCLSFQSLTGNPFASLFL